MPSVVETLWERDDPTLYPSASEHWLAQIQAHLVSQAQQANFVLLPVILQCREESTYKAVPLCYSKFGVLVSQVPGKEAVDSVEQAQVASIMRDSERPVAANNRPLQPRLQFTESHFLHQYILTACAPYCGQEPPKWPTANNYCSGCPQHQTEELEQTWKKSKRCRLRGRSLLCSCAMNGRKWQATVDEQRRDAAGCQRKFVPAEPPVAPSEEAQHGVQPRIIAIKASTAFQESQLLLFPEVDLATWSCLAFTAESTCEH
eukprot:1193303-Amphidinium_carterae.1